jgi:DNA-binding CsgD family transcriptional regulator
MTLMMLLERERELAEFDAVFGEIHASKGGAVAIEGAAGLGKTRLLQEARRTGADAGLNVLTARATELENDFPFSLVRQLFEPQLATFPAREREALFEGAGPVRGALGLDASEQAHDSFAVLHGLYWVTVALAERGPLLLAVDDAHWADAASLDYLGFLLPRLEELPVLLFVTSRPDEPDPPQGLQRILADASVRRLKPSALSAEATAALLAHELGHQPEPAFAGACYEVSCGNPLLLCELARTLLDQEIEPVAEQAERVQELAPEQVARMVSMRIARLPPEAGRVARSIAVLGDDSDHRLVAELSGIDPGKTQRAADALRAGNILDANPSLRFVHPLVRNAIYMSMPVGERELAHARAATLLRDRDASPERIATQLLASEARGERATVETLVEAAERALVTGAPRSAVAYLVRALHEPPPPELRAAVLGPLIVAGIRAADHSTLASIEADVFAELERQPSLRSRWAVELTRWMALSGRFEDAVSLLTEGIEVAMAEDDVERAFQLEAQLSTLALLVPSVPRVELERYADRIEPDSPAGRLAAVMEARSATVSGTAEDAADAARRALGNDGIIFAEEPDLVASSLAVMALVAADEMEEARYGAARALAIARDRNATTELMRAWYLNGFVAWAHGDLAAAEADMRQALDLAREAGVLPFVIQCTAPLIEVSIERDELEVGEAELQAIGMAVGPMPETAMFSLLQLMRGHLRFEQGKFEQAIEDFSTVSAYTERVGIGLGPTVVVSPFAARALVAVGEEGRARELVEGIMPRVMEWGAPASIAHGLRAVAVTQSSAERIESLGKAVSLLEGLPRRLELAHTLTDLGIALRRNGRRAEARVPLRAALEHARRCGAIRLARLAHDELEASGETVRSYAAIGVESLTPSERRVAELAASGLTNREIAQSLFVTVKTVEAHLSAAYDKLDIRSRRELAAALEEPSASSSAR